MDSPTRVAADIVVGDDRVAALEQADAILRPARDDSGDRCAAGSLEIDPVAVGLEGIGMENVEPVGLIPPLRSRAQRLASRLGDIHAADPVSASSIELDAIAVPPDPASANPDTIDTRAGDSDSSKVCGNRVAAFERDSGEIDPGSR